MVTKHAIGKTNRVVTALLTSLFGIFIENTTESAGNSKTREPITELARSLVNRTIGSLN